MDIRWWQLPGPSRFVAWVVQTLRDGSNVVLCLPEHTPDGLARAIRSALGDSDVWAWHTLQVSGPLQASPLQFLWSRFASGTLAATPRRVGALVDCQAFVGKVIWLSGVTNRTWPAWKAFLTEYEHACRSRSLLERTLFCVPLSGTLALDPPNDEVCLAHRDWRGVVDRLDMLLYTSSIFPSRRISPLQRQIAIAVVSSLALWDPVVSERLVREDLKYVLEPTPLLRELARERGWSAADCAPRGWQRGVIDRVDGREVIHSALLALANQENQLERRIWSAQVGVMFPFIEEKRQELLTLLGHLLTVPFKTRFGEVIDNPRDLELGHIESQIAEHNLPVAANIRQLVKQLRTIRNRLSHLEPLTSDLLNF